MYQGAVSIEGQARKNRLKPKSKQESVTFMPLNKEVKINNEKLFPLNWTQAFSNCNSPRRSEI